MIQQWIAFLFSVDAYRNQFAYTLPHRKPRVDHPVWGQGKFQGAEQLHRQTQCLALKLFAQIAGVSYPISPSSEKREADHPRSWHQFQKRNFPHAFHENIAELIPKCGISRSLQWEMFLQDADVIVGLAVLPTKLFRAQISALRFSAWRRCMEVHEIVFGDDPLGEQCDAPLYLSFSCPTNSQCHPKSEARNG